MDQVRIICPHCQLERLLPPDKLPPRPVNATCPRCRERFLFDPAMALPATPITEPPTSPESSDVQTAKGSNAPPLPPPTAPTSPPPEPNQGPAASKSAPIGPSRRQIPPRRELRGIGDLLGETWQLFQRRFATLFIIYLLFLAIGVLPIVAGAGVGVLLAMVLPLGKGMLVTLCALIGGLAGTLGFSWGWGAMVAASLDDSLDTRTAFERGKQMLLPFAWVCLLSGLIIAGGFLLLLIPGIIFTVWFFFATFVLADDDTRGMSALFKSRSLVAGHWFDVFLRLLVIWACSAIIGAIPVVGALLVMVATPYLLLYQALLYKDLKEVAGEVTYPCGPADYAKVIGVAAVGFILVPALIASTVGLSAYRKLASMGRPGNSPVSGRIELSAGAPATTADGYRVIPIPGSEPVPAPATTTTPGNVSAIPPRESAPEQRQKAPQHIHVFIYSVNYAGSVKANGAELKALETKPDMQYNYNLSGDKLHFGRNTFSIDYAPLAGGGEGSMSPRLHLKVTYWKGSERQVLGDWEIKETSPGQRSFDLDIAEHM